MGLFKDVVSKADYVSDLIVTADVVCVCVWVCEWIGDVVFKVLHCLDILLLTHQLGVGVCFAVFLIILRTHVSLHHLARLKRSHPGSRSKRLPQQTIRLAHLQPHPSQESKQRRS